MIKTLTVLLLLNTCALHAQDVRRTDLNKTLPMSFPGKDTLTPRKPYQPLVPRNGMPNAFLTKPDQPVYKGNNGMGSDIYESRIDKMSILVPDTSFSSAMPNGVQTYKNRIDTLSDMLNKRKQWNERYRYPKK
jgi:hypothetical protein